MIRIISVTVCIAILTISSGLHAQYIWHIVQPDRIDTFYHGITDISCSGENCTATEVLYSESSEDSNVIIHSTDGGLSWAPIDYALPQHHYTTDGMEGLFFIATQQIDSLDAIAVDQGARAIVRTSDGWETILVDTTNDTGDQVLNFQSLDFANPAEGMAYGGLGFYYFTTDSGGHWSGVNFMGGTSYHTYGAGMFRAYAYPVRIFTTHDSWETNDTTFITLNGSLQDTSLHRGALIFGCGDTLAYLCQRWDQNDSRTSMALVVSTDLGASWTELPVPRNNGIEYGYATLPTLDWHHMVIAGSDSIGRIVMSTNGGTSWSLDTVPLSNGEPYYKITSIAVTGSGRVIAAITGDSNNAGSNFLAYLELAPSSVSTPATPTENFTVFPNPATNSLNIVSSSGTVSITDPLGRSYNLRRNGSTLDISSLPPGVYFVSDGRARAKFVKE